MKNINQFGLIQIQLILLAAFMFLSPVIAMAQTEADSEFNCGAEYDPAIALKISAEYKAALKARDYQRLKELKAKRESINLWQKKYTRLCGDEEVAQESTAQGGTDGSEAPVDVNEPKMCSVDTPGTSACDDGLFCTSATGTEPGPDSCLNGACSGIAIKPVASNWSQGLAFDFGEVGKFLEKLQNFNKLIDTLKGHIGQKGNGSSGGSFSFAPTIEGRTRTTELCCEGTGGNGEMMTGREYEGSISINPVKYEWQSPSMPVPAIPAVKFGLDIEVAANVAGIVKGVNSECKNGCNKPDVEIQGNIIVGGGPYLAAFHPKILKLSGTVAARAGIQATFACLGPADYSPVCLHEVVLTGKVTALGGLNYDISRAFPLEDVCIPGTG